jgi:gamma-glutamyl-gamma-aminobutyraldehyde dehydrogenase
MAGSCPEYDDADTFSTNDTEYGLAAAVWSKDIHVAVRAALRIRAGTVAVNGYSEGDISTSFGGYRMPGFGGGDNGLEALEQYTEVKTIWATLAQPWCRGSQGLARRSYSLEAGVERMSV